jgi:hypothetical protein
VWETAPEVAETARDGVEAAVEALCLVAIGWLGVEWLAVDPVVELLEELPQPATNRIAATGPTASHLRARSLVVTVRLLELLIVRSFG